MNIGDTIAMLKLFPLDAPIQNAPCQPHNYLGDGNGLAFVQGETMFDQRESSTVGEMIAKLEFWLTQAFYCRRGMVPVTSETPIYIVSHQHQGGEILKGFLFTPNGIRFVKYEPRL